MAERDWTQPFLSESPDSLWQALHDASLNALPSDLLAREIRLELELGFPAPPEPLPKHVVMVCHEVTHVQIFISRPWPGPAPGLVTPITEEMEIDEEAYRQKGRSETIGLDVFQKSLPENPAEIMDASMHTTGDQVTLTLTGNSQDDHLGNWWELRIGAKSLDVVLPDGSPLGLEKLLRIGASGWETLS